MALFGGALLASCGAASGLFHALIDACHKRARPILMTTTTMGTCEMPIVLGMGADPRFRQPMAIIVIGRLLTSIMLSLLVVPVIFTLVDDALEAIGRALRRPHRVLATVLIDEAPRRSDNAGDGTVPVKIL